MGENQDLLAKLRAAKEAKRLSYQDIADLTEKNGEAVSLSTVKRVLHPDADIEDFRYNQTVRPIVRAILGMGEESEPEDLPEDRVEDYATIEAMKAVIDFKHEQLTERTAEAERLREEIRELKDHQREEIKELKDARREEITRVEASDQRKIDYLKDIITDLQRAANWYKKVIVVLGAVVLFAVIALIVDLSMGGVGWIRY